MDDNVMMYMAIGVIVILAAYLVLTFKRASPPTYTIAPSEPTPTYTIAPPEPTPTYTIAPPQPTPTYTIAPPQPTPFVYPTPFISISPTEKPYVITDPTPQGTPFPSTYAPTYLQGTPFPSTYPTYLQGTTLVEPGPPMNTAAPQQTSTPYCIMRPDETVLNPEIMSYNMPIYRMRPLQSAETTQVCWDECANDTICKYAMSFNSTDNGRRGCLFFNDRVTPVKADPYDPYTKNEFAYKICGIP